MRIYSVNLDEATINSPEGFTCFNDFFTRELLANARPLQAVPNVLVSPCDGRVSQVGQIISGQVLQAKELYYSVSELICDEQLAKQFEGGFFATLYLAPQDYHRVHMPVAASILNTRFESGRLLSVKPKVVATRPGLFTQNERLIITCDASFGQMVIVMVGALLVSGIRTVWRDGYYHRDQEAEVLQPPLQLAAGEELGRFDFGSTVILLLPPNKVILDDHLKPQTAVQCRAPIGKIKG